MEDPQEKTKSPFKDGYDVIAAILVGGVVIWFVQSGGYAALESWFETIL
jgi:hypothetical protein